jgi:isoleucyl-tRNA synthetase
LLSNLFDFDPAQDTVTYDQLPESDRYILHRLAEVTKDVTEAYDNFQFSRFFQTIQNFCTVDLSNFYLDIAKDRLYISSPNAPRRRSCQTVLMYCLEAITKAIAPVLAHTAEDIWQHLPYPVPQKSVFQAGWFTAHDEWYKPELAGKWKRLRLVRSRANMVMELRRQEKLIGSSLESRVKIIVSLGIIREDLLSLLDGHQLEDLFICSQVEVVFVLPEEIPQDYLVVRVHKDDNTIQPPDHDLSDEDLRKLFNPEATEPQDDAADSNYRVEGVIVLIERADGEKCPRCYNYSTHIGESAEHPHICDRCVGALAATF